ncbi:hypothetical protein AVEN_103609-1 [Araneus ventricosus]|uniref:Uncharacterized protein n=1 Tax=Araneus ventricosus TaxID=182803 RepID=A0A4Y2I815_ARAVE|nr:hypothetical protein AVEN_103609-1 [Araneus ventricosus]
MTFAFPGKLIVLRVGESKYSSSSSVEHKHIAPQDEVLLPAGFGCVRHASRCANRSKRSRISKCQKNSTVQRWRYGKSGDLPAEGRSQYKPNTTNTCKYVKRTYNSFWLESVQPIQANYKCSKVELSY